MAVAEVQRLTPTEFVERSGKGELWRLLDVREPWEMSVALVAGSMAMPMAQVPGRLSELSRHEPVAVICHSGMRSATVAAWLLRQGFESVANIEGGIDAWSVQVDGTIPRY